jgi:antitoxin HigA-1
MAKTRRVRPPIHPGEILREELMKPLKLSANKLALELRVPSNRILEIVNGERAITADTALRLARYFGMTAQFWINAQGRYDLEKAQDELAQKIEREVNPRAA